MKKDDKGVKGEDEVGCRYVLERIVEADLWGFDRPLLLPLPLLVLVEVRLRELVLPVEEGDWGLASVDVLGKDVDAHVVAVRIVWRLGG